MANVSERVTGSIQQIKNYYKKTHLTYSIHSLCSTSLKPYLVCPPS
uniref:Uncharacterized protein n=1 Tax=Anguilla anguilla TaxID=7936 RepID=A0A0E9RS35_ANGAN